MEQINISFGDEDFSVYFKVEYPPIEKLCSVCKKKQTTAGISIFAEEVINASTQIPLEKNSPFWADIQAHALKEYEHELRVAEAISMVYEKYPDPKDSPSKEEISEVLKNLRFVCFDCENIALEKKERALELLKKQEELIYEPKHKL